MPLEVGNTLVVRSHVKMFDQIGINVMHYWIPSAGPTAATELQFANAWGALWGPLMRNLISVHANYVGVVVQKIHPAPAAEPVQSADGSGAGLVLGDPLPKQTCGMITKRTGNAGREWRGRIYVPFPGEGSCDADATPTAIYLGDLAALAAHIRLEISITAGGIPTVFRPFLKNKFFPDQRPAITGTTVRDKWAVQRRRGDYGQPNSSPF